MPAPAVTPAEAKTLLDEGTPGAADIILWLVLQKNPRDARAWDVLSRVARAIGADDFAHRYAGVAANLRGEPAPDPQPCSTGSRRDAAPDDERYLIIKAWGYGFCSDLDHTVAGLLLAEMTGRTPVTHWGGNSLFSVSPERDAFREYFEPVSPVRLEDVVAEVGGEGPEAFWPPKWNRENLNTDRPQKANLTSLTSDGCYTKLAGIQFLNRPERVAIADYHLAAVTLVPWIAPGHPMHGRDVEATLRYIFAKYIRPLPDLRDQIESFRAEHFRAHPIIGVHVRGSDKYKEEANLAQWQAVYPQAIEHVERTMHVSGSRILLITDSKPIAEEYQKRYGPRLILPPAIRSDSAIGVHHLGHTDRRAIGAEVVRDIYLAAACDMFVGLGSSNVSATIHHLKEWPAGSTVYLSPIMTHREDPGQYLHIEQLERYHGAEWAARMRAAMGS